MDTSQVLAITTVTLSFLSLCSCIYVILTSYDKTGFKFNCSCPCLQIPEPIIYNINNDDNDLSDSPKLNLTDIGSIQQTTAFDEDLSSPRASNLMIDIIFCMVVTDALHSISIFINWFPSLSPSIPFYSSHLCMVFGITAEFLVIQSPCWHVLLALHLFCLLCGCCATNKLTSYKKYHIAVVCVFIPALVATIPCIVDGGIKHAYGSFDNLSHSDAECWVKSKSFQIIYVVFILGSLLIHYIVVSVALYKYWSVYSGLRLRYWTIVLVLFRFVIVFSIIRFFPALERIVALIYNAPAPTWLIMMHHIGISSLGIGDGFVWYLNQRKTEKEEWDFESTTQYLNKNNNNNNLDRDIIATPDQIHIYSPSPALSYLTEPKQNVEKKKHVVFFRGRM